MNSHSHEILDLTALKAKIAEFAKERDWEQFHTPKNLAMALSVEASELAEIFQWLTEKQSYEIVHDEKELLKVKDELADIITYAVRLCGVLNINLPQELERKMKQNAEKYPVEKAKGVAKKYTELK